MEFLISYDSNTEKEGRFTQSVDEALAHYEEFLAEAKQRQDGSVTMSILVKSETIEADEKVIDEAFDQSLEPLTRRRIHTNTHQLGILKKALQAMSPEELTPVENYELGMLVAMIRDTIREKDPEVEHGWTL